MFKVNKIYEVEAFGNDEACQFFCKHAFKQDNPHKDFTVLVNKVVRYAKGNPLALKVVGSSLYGKKKQDWESALHKLNKVSNPKIHNLLRISYDGLDTEEKEIFLDIACFFKGKCRDFVTRILKGCYYSAPFGLNVLVDKSLITISLDDKIEMHDLLQELGRELVRQESSNKPGERSRLHNPEDVCRVLQKNTNSKILQSKQTYLYLPDELRYLRWDGYPTKALPSSFSPESVIELDLRGSNLKELWRGKMDAPKLQRLNLSSCRQLTRISEFSIAPSLECINFDECRNLLDSGSAFQNLNNLRFLSLKCCEKFRSFPEIAGNIEILDLHGTAIVEVPSSIGSLTKLTFLRFSNCTRLKHISPDICFTDCSNLETFPEILEIMGSLEELDLYGTAIKELPISIENLNGLLHLSLDCCEILETLPTGQVTREFGELNIFVLSRTALRQLPSSLTSLEKLRFLDCSKCRDLALLPPMSGLLQSLTILDLKDCNLTKIPEDIGCLSSLCKLELNGNDIESLPKSIKQLSKLGHLRLNNCSRIHSLPELPLGLSYLEAVNCKQLQSLPNAYHFAESVIECGSNGYGLEYVFTNCVKLDKSVFGHYWEESLLKVQRGKSQGVEVSMFWIFSKYSTTSG
ncbi:hypothetical protein Ddye_024723 [Dipteronia dyeriana]|uniref:Uncharacterized protein n=1 Tax=Dipteronia dyeriana TaxID=168575 RepID=A0AAD9WUR1_9ROSI|nr:hypothetical protein Ddye_024723 [Dipteronia dyeriana]